MEVYGRYAGTARVEIRFGFPPDDRTPEARQAVVDAMLATVEWKQ